jgi:hypothetical protein
MRQRALPIANHLVNRFLRDLGNYSVWVAVLSVVEEQHEFLTLRVQQIQTRSITQGDVAMAKVGNVGAIRSQRKMRTCI